MSPGYDPAHFDALTAVEDRHFWFTSRNRLLADVLGRVALPARPRVLEVGAGTGNTLRVLERAYPGATLVGMDLYADGFAAARRRTRAHLVQARLEAPPFACAFDLVAAFDVIEHVADDLAALTRLRSLLTPAGFLVLTVPALARLWGRVDEEARHVRRYEIDGLRERLLAAGYATVSVRFAMAALYPVLRMARRVADWTHRAGDPSSALAGELRVVPVANAAMSALLSAEARLVAAGWQPPVGTSLVAVARPLGPS